MEGLVRRTGFTRVCTFVRPLFALLTLLPLVTACRGDGGYSGPLASNVREAVPRIEDAVGLTFKRPPTLEMRSRVQVREFLERRFAEELPAAEIVGLEAAYRRFGLLPDTLQLGELYLTLLTEQIVGFYDPETSVLYVVEEAAESQRATIVSHELIHALQDQYIDLAAIQRERGDNDRALAVQAFIEGQATFEQIQSSIGSGGLAARLPGGWDRVRQMIREGSTSMPLFANAPRILQETMIFPYLSGAEFVRRNDVDGAAQFERLPVSTEQIMHPHAFGDSIDAPTRVVLPALGSGTLLREDNLGEFEMRIMIFEHLQDQNAAVRGAAGWDGDRYVLAAVPGGDALAWASVWDSEQDADEFASEISRTLARRYGERNPSPAARSFTLAGRTIAVSRFAVDGRPMVLVDDRPTGFTGDLIDATEIRLEDLPGFLNAVRN